MNEEQIAEELIQKMRGSSEPVETQPSEGSPPPADLLDQLTELKLLDYFQVQPSERSGPEAKGLLERVYKWAVNEAGTNDYLTIIEHIRTNEAKLGLADHPIRLAKLAQFIKLQEQSRAIDKEMERVVYG